MKRHLIIIIGILLIINGFSGCAAPSSTDQQQSLCRCLPDNPCWPDDKSWAALAGKLTGRLVKPQSTVASCRKDLKSQACTAELKNVNNPFFVQSAPGGFQMQGWMGAWMNEISVYAVEA